jgi:hypothetical protein
MVQTIWTNTDNFLDIYYGLKSNEDPNGDQVGTFKTLFDTMDKLDH